MPSKGFPTLEQYDSNPTCCSSNILVVNTSKGESSESQAEASPPCSLCCLAIDCTVLVRIDLSSCAGSEQLHTRVEFAPRPQSLVSPVLTCPWRECPKRIPGISYRYVIRTWYVSFLLHVCLFSYLRIACAVGFRSPSPRWRSLYILSKVRHIESPILKIRYSEF